MKTTKFFFMAALALMMTACSNDDNDIAQQPVKAEGIPFTATISVGESGTTRALSESGSTLVATWAVDDKVALIHNGVKDVMTVASVSAGVATITGTITSATDGADVTVIYPATAADGTTGNVKSNWLSSQVGTLANIAANYDVRKGTGTLKVSGTASLNGNVSLTNQNAIFKLTLKDIDGTSDVSATSVIISDQNGVVTTVTTSATNEMYVALPTTATTLKFLVTGSDSKKYFNMASSLSLGASYYQSTVKLATVGDVILSTGKCAKAGTSGAVAKIAYLGNDAETSPTNTAFKNGLALALYDVSTSNVTTSKAWCSQRSATCLGTQYDDDNTKFNDLAGIANTDALVNHTSHTHDAASAARGYNSGTHPAGTSAWFLPSAGQWDKMTGATGLGLSNLGLMMYVYYWSSTEYNGSLAWHIRSEDASWGNPYKDVPNKHYVRACLAF